CRRTYGRLPHLNKQTFASSTTSVPGAVGDRSQMCDDRFRTELTMLNVQPVSIMHDGDDLETRRMIFESQSVLFNPQSMCASPTTSIQRRSPADLKIA
ncbi:hypothetical protein, partial [Paraburkholderia kirstenboschensis]|uniref:hypothetical protein n=1 Tax=Paraburkholderia kirstenboschensis TaxID=1245436 RepID=UPI001FB4B55F